MIGQQLSGRGYSIPAGRGRKRNGLGDLLWAWRRGVGATHFYFRPIDREGGPYFAVSGKVRGNERELGRQGNGEGGGRAWRSAGRGHPAFNVSFEGGAGVSDIGSALDLKSEESRLESGLGLY